MASISSIASTRTHYPPSCIEFWPSNPEYFVVGTYLLEQQSPDDKTGKDSGTDSTAGENEPSQLRKGSVLLYRLIGDSIRLTETLHTQYAVLDIHFSPKDPDIFCTANSTGDVAFYGLEVQKDPRDAELSSHDENRKHRGTRVMRGPYCMQLFPQTTLILSCNWHPTCPTLLGLSLSTGEVAVCRVDLDRLRSLLSMGEDAEGGKPTCLGANEAGWSRRTVLWRHDLEAWTVNFTPIGSGVFSGGDDASIRFRNVPASCRTTPNAKLRLEEEFHEESDEGSWVDGRIHQAGVTAILPLSEDICVTGSYDDHVRVISTPHVGKRQVMAELNLGGGVWRLKLVEGVQEAINAKGGGMQDGILEGLKKKKLARSMILASCMHAGARVLKIERSANGNWDIEVLAKFEEHQSMNYACDFVPLTSSGPLTVVSTSFYDNLLCMWKVETRGFWREPSSN